MYYDRRTCAKYHSHTLILAALSFAACPHCWATVHRFTEMFTLDTNKVPHMWTARQDIPSIAKGARLAAANVLAQLAASCSVYLCGLTPCVLKPVPRQSDPIVHDT